MDVKLLADTLTLFLAPAMPYLVSGGEELVKAAGKAVGEGGLEMAKKLWARLRPKIEEKPAAAEAAQEVAKAPEDADAQGALRLQLRKILEADASLAAELAKLVEAAGPRETYFAQLHGSGAIAQGKGNVVAGAGGIAVGRDLKAGIERDEEES
ncbi:MAG TPA: hypothetical protein VE685_03850 [Thermoanaerobaculia bacterium]|nr:hypothetical protein [Thermoanaerobaculia bacterium]